ncbi:maltose alpha-D-glucosyltransferase [Rugosimonospora africana]|uniref:Alpha-amylase n=1 Tax=Rugosimonospora africana TaxID=556532 RepID=A0A8J3R683_9ACTN|nr:maltose alpha-D-glucosyltransferase [Rugosimonospora africana]GIH20781.1 trehalose synthase/amylase TreS [Rugosimonospora africana]
MSRRTARRLPVEPDWFKRAVFYEVLVQACADSNADGHGDLPGLTGKLDYLQWLGVDCVWLPPFYDSPLRDGGYDIRDYYTVSPECGTIDDFVTLLDEAHARGIRVITDLVLNHTSDTHQWFQESRRDPHGPYGDFYVWRDSDTDYAGVRVIFHDTEPSNWTFDPVRQQFYWHRFYHHQPDLNYENPAVQEAMLDIVRFWLNLGIDGFRLDAATYLYEREGTECANLPETHAYLRRLRKVIDDEYPGCVLLAEANLWPTDLVQYFGDASVGGDECHMAFHFPLMPRIFMAVRRESRRPITEILAQTPAIPSGCQWGTFLRNHDELTLEMVTDEERDYLWAEYAKDPRMRLNAGIRRRLAPMVGNDRNQIELFTSLLLSLPGSPVIYYGDEIGMGDNVYLGDRDGVRTPMQWSPDRNGGFSRCDPGQLYLPVNAGWVYGYQAVNVERQQDQSASLLQWTRRMIEVRKQHPALAVGEFHDLGGSNPAVLAFLRETADEVILCVHNLSRHPEPVLLPLGPRFRRQIPVELTGSTIFPAIGLRPYLLTLPGYGSYWFRIVPSRRHARVASHAGHLSEPASMPCRK